MSKVLIGSLAMQKQIGPVKKREPKDADFLVWDDIELPEVFEGLPAESLRNEKFGEWEWSGEVASLDELYTVKVSHSFWNLRNRSWEKHMFDVKTLKQAGAEFIPELHEILYPIWEEIHGKKKANLEQEPDRFFNPSVDRKYEHDSIHASVAYYDEPLFNRILRDNHAVAVSRKKFENLSEEDKVKLVREEVYATALERHLIPNDYAKSYQWAYHEALKQTITSFSKGWFPLWIVLNYEMVDRPAENFVKIHKENSDKLVPKGTWTNYEK